MIEPEILAPLLDNPIFRSLLPHTTLAKNFHGIGFTTLALAYTIIYVYKEGYQYHALLIATKEKILFNPYNLY